MSDFDRSVEEIHQQRIETTVGDLIAAIAEAAREATVDETLVALCVQAVLRNLKVSQR